MLDAFTDDVAWHEFVQGRFRVRHLLGKHCGKQLDAVLELQSEAVHSFTSLGAITHPSSDLVKDISR
jgi:hypothetical protein